MSSFIDRVLISFCILTSLVLVESPTQASENEPVASVSLSPQKDLLSHQDHEFWSVFHQDSGVTSNLLFNYFGRFYLGARLNLLVGGGLSLFENSGLALLGVGAEIKVDEIWSRFAFVLQHERWPDWTATENRILAYWEFRPLASLNLAVGYSYRSPQFAGLGAESFNWPLKNAEWGPVYRLQWTFLGDSGVRPGQISASILIFNYDRMRLFTSDNTHFSIIPEYQMSRSVSAQAMVMTAVKGISGAVISWDQLDLGLGLKYEF